MNLASDLAISSYPSLSRPLPRERLVAEGAAALTDVELLAIILGTGTSGNPVLDLAGEVLTVLNSELDALSVSSLSNLRGLGPKKAATVVAAIELIRRRIKPSGVRVRSPADLLPLLHPYTNESREHFLSFTLNAAHDLIRMRVVSVGTLNQTPVHPREVFADALADRAFAVIVAHNHPSGDLTPSSEDLSVTKRLREAGKLLGVELIDHLIVAASGYTSLRERIW